MNSEEVPRGPAYRVETERLVIRPWSPADAPQLREALDVSDAHLRPFIPWMRGEPRSLHETAGRLRAYRAAFDRDEDYRRAVLDRDEKILLGETGLYTRAGEGAREIGYWIDVRHGGKGYAIEATMAMVKVGFEIDGVERIEIHCAPTNELSAAIPKKLGFLHEATLRRRFTDSEGDIQDSMLWTLFSEDYAGTRSSQLKLRAYDCMGARIL